MEVWRYQGYFEFEGAGGSLGKDLVRRGAILLKTFDREFLRVPTDSRRQTGLAVHEAKESAAFFRLEFGKHFPQFRDGRS